MRDRINQYTSTRLWQGCVLSSIANMLYWCPRNGGPGESRLWEGRRYRRDNGSADWGRLVFVGDEVVGAFFSHESERSPYLDDDEWPALDFDYTALFAGLSSELWTILRNEIIPVMTIESMDPRPGITAGLWSEEGKLRTAEPWDQMMEHGGFLIEVELMEFDAAVDALQGEKDLTEQQIVVLRRLYERRVTIPRSEPVIVEPDDLRLILAAEPDYGDPLVWRPGEPLPEYGIQVMRQVWAPINIVVPGYHLSQIVP